MKLTPELRLLVQKKLGKNVHDAVPSDHLSKIFKITRKWDEDNKFSTFKMYSTEEILVYSRMKAYNLATTPPDEIEGYDVFAKYLELATSHIDKPFNKARKIKRNIESVSKDLESSFLISELFKDGETLINFTFLYYFDTFYLGSLDTEYEDQYRDLYESMNTIRKYLGVIFSLYLDFPRDQYYLLIDIAINSDTDQVLDDMYEFFKTLEIDKV